MNATSPLLPESPRRYVRMSTLPLAAVLALAPVGAVPAQPAEVPSESRIADVSMADLDLSSARGMQAARDRLTAVAERFCGARSRNRELLERPNFAACVDSTVSHALKQMRAFADSHTPVRNSVTRAAKVNLDDLDLATLEGLQAARERLRTIAQRLCSELARSQDLRYQPNYTACVDETLEGALAQVRAVALSKAARTARGNSP
jgi:UrcA family protein